MKTVIFILIVSLPLPAFIPARAEETNRAALVDTVQSMAYLDNTNKLGPGDKITYRVIEDQDEPRSLTITDSGHLDVPYLGLVQAAGKTSYELATAIKPLLEQKLYVRATVIIGLLESGKRLPPRMLGKVYVTGQVRNQGGYDIPAGQVMTVSRAILNAGGFIDFSDKRNVRLIRKTADGQQKTYIVNVQNVWEKSKVQEDLVVQPEDLIVVPTRFVNY